ncbi:MAG TPA: CapA family protein [Microbacteriaceae bacterium]|nr:CapA family protein [Microbacteriaceae bacterium]
MKLKPRILGIGSIFTATILLLSACASSQEPTVEPAATVEKTVQDEPKQEVEAEPEAEKMPGKGPECPTDHCVSVTVSGDLLFHESLWSPFAIDQTAAGLNFDFDPLFEGLRPYLEKADLNICQAETPFAQSGGPYAAYPVFNTPPEVAHAAKDAGFDVCTTASNHSVDQGTEGLVRSLDLLDEIGLKHTGTYRTPEEYDDVLIVEANDTKIGIITSTFSLNGFEAEEYWMVDYPLDSDRVIAKAKQAREQGADLVIAALHAGEEYWDEPNEQQYTHAHALAESGEIDFIYSHHAHAVQPLEKVGDKWILYGTGNLISESAPPERQMNNEFLLTRVQFAKQDDGSWATNDVSWVPGTNIQNGEYRWCSVASDSPQGVCQSPEFDAGVYERTKNTVNAYGAAENGAREWLVTQE